MDDAAIVRVRQRLCDVPQHTHHRADRETAVLRETNAERFTLHERHRVERQSVRLSGREDGDDVRLLQRCGELYLALEPVAAESLGQLRRQHLDDDFPVEATLVGDEHARHAPAAEFAVERVRRTKSLLQLLAEIHASPD